MSKSSLLMLMFIAFVMSSLLTFGCGGGDETETDGDDVPTDGDEGTDGDPEDNPDGDIDGEAEAEAGVHFEYPGCIKISKEYQYPTPAWEQPGESLTGVFLNPPANDKGANLLKSAREPWYSSLDQLDGFPLAASWFVALSSEGSPADIGKVKLYSWTVDGINDLPDPELSMEILEDKKVLMIRAGRPLSIPAFGERYILAMYAGALDGAAPYPACDGTEPHADYIAAADALVSAGHGENLELALPFTATRTAVTHRPLYEKLLDEKPLTVKTINKHDSFDYLETIADDEDFSPDAETEALLNETYYDGRVSVPYFQNEDGVFVLDLETATPIRQGTTDPGFVVAWPKAGSAPYPVVIFQHGGSRFKYDLFRVAKPYLEQGFAMLGVDLPYHGDFGSGSDVDMLPLDNPLMLRDNFRQASSNHMSIITGIETINSALENEGEAAGLLDAGKIFYMGHSMGSVSGTLTSATADILGASLIAGGAPYRVFVSDGMFALMINDIVNMRPAIESQILLQYIQSLLDGGDPVNFPTRLENKEMAPKDVLLWEILRDPAAINPATEAQALAFGSDLAAPPYHPVPGMTELTAPFSGNFSWTEGGEESATRVLTQYDKPEMSGLLLHMEIFLNPISHRASAACFAGKLNDGICVYQTQE